MARGIKAGEALVKVLADSTVLQAGLRKAQATLRGFAAGAEHLGRRMFAVAAVALAPLALSTRVFAGFSDQMAEAGAVTQATADELRSMTEVAKELGRTTSFTAQQVAEGMTELGRAGFRPDEVNVMISPLLSLARATRTELAEAATIASAAMRGFRLEASDTAHISDVLVTAANKSAQSLADVGEALKYVAPQAAEANETLEDTNAALMVMANQGIKGTLAGNALARAYKNLSKAQTQQVLASVGVSAVDVSGNLRKVADVIADVAAATAPMGTAGRLSIFEQLFGRGQAAALKLAGAGAFAGMRRELEGIDGVAQRTAKTMDDTLGGSFRILMSAVEGVQLAIGDALTGTLRGAMSWLTAAAGAATRFINAHRGVIVAVAKIAARLAAAGVGILGFALAIKGVAFILGGLQLAVSVAAAVLGALASPLGIAAVALVGIGGAVGVASGYFDDLLWTAQTTVRGIVKALKRGDIEAALDVVGAGLKAAWLATVLKIEELWQGLKLKVIEIAVSLWAGIQKSWVDSGTYEGFWELITGMQKAWAWFASWVLRAWAFTTGKLRQLNEEITEAVAAPLARRQLQERVDRGIISQEAMDKALRQQEEQHLERLAQIDVETKAKQASIAAEFDERMSTLRSEYEERLALVAKGSDAVKAKIDEERDAALKAAKEEHEAKLRAAQKELDAAKATLKAEPDVAGQSGTSGSGGPAARVRPRLEVASSALAAAMEAQGSFGTTALNRLGLGSNVSEKMLGELQTMNRTLRDIEDNTDEGLVFG